MLRTVTRILICIVFVSLLTKCNDDTFPETPYPKVKTLEVTSISGNGVTFQAAITQQSKESIVNHGFIWGPAGYLNFNNGDKIDLGANASAGSFQTELLAGLAPDSTYYVRAFITTNTYLVYGEVVSFKSKGSHSPVISGFSPKEATWGDTITITGQFFSKGVTNNHVSFGTLESKVVKSTESTIVCIVPNNIADKTVAINLNVAGYKTKSSDNLTLLSPIVDSFLPAVATFGEPIAITGKNFSLNKEQNIVKFGDIVAEVSEASKTKLIVRVPNTVIKKENALTVTVNLQTSADAGKFNISPPIVYSLSTDKEFTGGTVQINGDNFNPVMSGNVVMIGDLVAPILSVERTSIKFQIPDGIYKSRSFNVEVVVAEQGAFSLTKITLQNAWIRKADVPNGDYGRYGGVAFSIDGKGYIGLGNSTSKNDFWRFDPQENVWTQIASFPGTPVAGMVAFVIDNIGYVGGGGNDGFWKYDPGMNRWSQIADLPVTSSQSVGLSIDGRGFVVTTNESNNFWAYDPASNIWTAMTDYPGVYLPYDYPDAGFELNGKLFIFSADNSTGPNSFYNYDINTNLWTQKASVDDANFSHGVLGFSIGGYGYIRGGYYLYKYDPTNDSWLNNLIGDPGVRTLGLSFVTGGKVYVGGGPGLSDLWEFDPAYQ